MWLITTIGFFSVVQKPGDDDLTVRARSGADLDRLRSKYLPELGKTTQGGGTDYQYRAKVGHAALGAAMSRLVASIDYGNFKDEVGRQQGFERKHVYSRLWANLQGIPDE